MHIHLFIHLSSIHQSCGTSGQILSETPVLLHFNVILPLKQRLIRLFFYIFEQKGAALFFQTQSHCICL